MERKIWAYIFLILDFMLLCVLFVSTFGLSDNFIETYNHNWEHDPEIIVYMGLLLFSVASAAIFLAMKRFTAALFFSVFYLLFFAVIIFLGLLLQVFL